jgi:mRNA interferase RelE/StbE
MSKWTIMMGREAEKRLSTIPKPQRQRISEAIDMLENGPYECGLDVKALKGRPEWRLRVGPWRVLFLVDHGIITIKVVSVGPRGDIYKN